jgi:hypothetical protein
LETITHDGSRGREGISKKSVGPHGGKKRKLAAIDSIPALALDEGLNDDSRPMKSDIEGTFRRAPSTDKKDNYLYKPGMGERIELFSDWRDMFENSQPFQNPGKKPSLSIRKRTNKSIVRTARSIPIGVRSPTRFDVNGFQETKGIGKGESDQPLNPKRRRISFEKSSRRPPVHKVVVEIPRSKTSETQKKNESKHPHVQGHQIRPDRKRKVCDEEIDGSCDENAQPRVKRVASKKTSFVPPETSSRRTRSKHK